MDKWAEIQALNSRIKAIQDCMDALTDKLQGDGGAQDDVIHAKLAALLQEQNFLDIRVEEIAGGGSFTAPTQAQQTALSDAIDEVNKAVHASDDVNKLAGLLSAATSLLGTYGSQQSK